MIAFFATGLIVKETTYTTKVTVDRPIDTVFSTLVDVNNMQEWVKDIKSIEVVNSTQNITGSVYKITVDNQGYDVEMTQKVEAFEPNEKVTYFYDADNMLKTDTYKFSTTNNKTIISKTSVCRSDSYVMSCIFPYFKGTFQEIDQQYLDDFKEFIEKNN